MRIMINGLLLVPDRIGGLETYVRQLVYGLARIDTVNRYDLVVGPEAAPTFKLPSERWRVVVSPARSSRRALRVVLEQLWLPYIAKRLGADVLHSGANTGPVVSGVPSVATIHDMKYKPHPEDLTVSERLVFAALLPAVARRSSHVIADSQSAGSEIVRWTGVPSSRVTVVPIAPRPHWPGHPGEDAARLAALGIAGPYLLSVATSYPHKNLQRLVEALPLEDENGRPVQLVLTGLKARAHDAITEAARHRPDLIKILGWVDDASLAALYRNALALAYPSLYEGFGLPIVEAMALGTPVLTSNYGAMAEVADNAAELVDPGNVDDIRRGLSRIVQDPRHRARLRELGSARASEFSWDRTALMTRQVYERVGKAA